MTWGGVLSLLKRFLAFGASCVFRKCDTKTAGGSTGGAADGQIVESSNHFEIVCAVGKEMLHMLAEGNNRMGE